MPGSCRISKTGYQYNIRANLMMDRERSNSTMGGQPSTKSRSKDIADEKFKSCEWRHAPPMRFHNERVFLFGE